MSPRPTSIRPARRPWPWLAQLLAALLPLSSAERASPGAARPPNIVLLLADDLGYGDIGANGGSVVRTPAVDRLAAEGQRWSDFYAAGCVCVPSRLGPSKPPEDFGEFPLQRPSVYNSGPDQRL